MYLLCFLCQNNCNKNKSKLHLVSWRGRKNSRPFISWRHFNLKVFPSISILFLLDNFESMYVYLVFLSSLAKGSHKFGARMYPSSLTLPKKRLAPILMFFHLCTTWSQWDKNLSDIEFEYMFISIGQSPYILIRPWFFSKLPSYFLFQKRNRWFCKNIVAVSQNLNFIEPYSF